MTRQTRFSLPPPSSFYSNPTSAFTDDEDGDDARRRSTIFPYSLARPDTRYSAPKPKATSLKLRSSRLSAQSEAEDEDEDQEPMQTFYARSDWDVKTTDSNLVSNKDKDESRDEHARYNLQDASNSVSPSAAKTSSSMTRRSKAARSTMPSILDLCYLAGVDEHPTKRQPDRYTKASAKRLSQLRGRSSQIHGAHSDVDRDPHLRSGPSAAQASGTGAAASPRLITPEKQHRIGRMSVAPARYSLPPPRRFRPTKAIRSSLDRPSSISSVHPKINNIAPTSFVTSIKQSRAVRWYLTWRPFLLTLFALVSALLLTMAIADDTALGFVLVLEAGAMAVMPSDGTFGLSVGSWCQLGGDCAGYRKGTFIAGQLRIPGHPLFDRLAPLYTLLASVTWLYTIFTLTAAFLHFYMFYVLSIPFSHLVDAALTQPGQQSSAQGHQLSGASLPMEEAQVDSVQVEVDIQVRCERIPGESYVWVWWAWWGHRRGPVGEVYVLILGLTALCGFAMALEFAREAKAASQPGTTSIGFGTYLPLLVFLSHLDPFISSLNYLFLKPRISFSTFLHPPPPTPAAILLPPSEKPLAHHRPHSGASSFFAPVPPTALPANNLEDTRHPPHLHRRQGQRGVGLNNQEEQDLKAEPGLDSETRHWLSHYPLDADLVPLIASLRSLPGMQNDNFILSDVGLLYLRPEADGAGQGQGEGVALLVPPKGVREGLLEDAHLDDATATVIGGSGHVSPEGMLSSLRGVFWWIGMEDDVRGFVGRCCLCAKLA